MAQSGFTASPALMNFSMDNNALTALSVLAGIWLDSRSLAVALEPQQLPSVVIHNPAHALTHYEVASIFLRLGVIKPVASQRMYSPREYPVYQRVLNCRPVHSRHWCCFHRVSPLLTTVLQRDFRCAPAPEKALRFSISVFYFYFGFLFRFCYPYDRTESGKKAVRKR